MHEKEPGKDKLLCRILYGIALTISWIFGDGCSVKQALNAPKGAMITRLPTIEFFLSQLKIVISKF